MWTIHHATIDGRSFEIILAEVFAAYDARGEGAPRASGLPAPGFSAFAAWLNAQDSAPHEAFWRETLAGRDAPTGLPCADPLHVLGAEEERARRATGELAEETTRALEATAQRAGVT